jgi:hypothetical protein
VLIVKKIKFLPDTLRRKPLLRNSLVACSVIRDASLGYGRRLSLIIAVVAVLGCGPSSPERAEDYLIRLGELKVTRHDFLQAFELVKTAYPGGVDSDSPELQHARRLLLNEMTVDLMILNRSRELGITVSEAELEAAVASVKADYPPGGFEKALDEAVLPLQTWKQRLHSRLLMEKLVDLELRPHIIITADDITAYYERNYQGKAVEAASDEQFERLKRLLVVDLRRAKLEEAFDAWIGSLRSRCPVEVNASQWARIAEAGPRAASSQADAAEPRK